MLTEPAIEAPRVLVTGSAGFVGKYFCAKLRDCFPTWRLDMPCGPGQSTRAAGVGALDITDAASVERYIENTTPDIVIHLAAVAAVRDSLTDPRLAWDVNLGGTLNLVLALQKFAPNARMFHVSSAEVYGASLAGGEPTDERSLLQPLNPYAASKAAADILVRQAATGGLKSLIVRPFNHTGYGQSETFVVPSFAAQVARIEAGLQPPKITVGNLDEERDFLDVGDVVDAYISLLPTYKEWEEDVFNVASGSAIRIGDILEWFLTHSDYNIAVDVNSKLLRTSSIPKVVGSARLLQAQSNWAPKMPLEKTFESMLESYRAKLSKIN